MSTVDFDLIKEPTYLTKDEIKLLWKFLAYEYISYENLPLLELVRKISSIANEE